jgi:iron complex outermembrane recepter protein
MRKILSCFVLITLFLMAGSPLRALEDNPTKATATEKKSKSYELEPVVVTAPAMQAPLEVHFDPKAPQQPIPAQDGAAILKTVPGMNVIRKGGTDGDPVFRGMAGSRLNILLDGETILGGCGNRMDPPTAYVFPEAYDRITVLKGPQTVMYGPGGSAGIVLFEREFKHFEEPGVRFNGSLMGGSFGRHDEIADVTAGNQHFYFRGTGTNSRSGDYEDGDGKDVHSKYNRWSLNSAVGWTPNKDTRLELKGAHSDGEAAYADRSMDGKLFNRWNYGLKFEKKNLNSWLGKVEAQAYYNYVDHVMDNYSLRTFVPTAMMPNPSASNPARETIGGRLAFKIIPAEMTAPRGLHAVAAPKAAFFKEMTRRKTWNGLN